MYVVPVSWIRHVGDVLGRDSPVLRGALDAAGLAPAVLQGDLRVVRVRHFVDDKARRELKRHRLAHRI